MFQPIVKAFIVAIIKPLLHEFPFEVPVRFGNEFDIRVPFFDLADEFRPVFHVRLCTGTSSPGALKNGGSLGALPYHNVNHRIVKQFHQAFQPLPVAARDERH
jgi:hypothetical protein